jgi:hypothetical protein
MDPKETNRASRAQMPEPSVTFLKYFSLLHDGILRQAYSSCCPSALAKIEKANVTVGAVGRREALESHLASQLRCHWDKARNLHSLRLPSPTRLIA